MARFNLDNYVDVQERINRFWSEHENGSIVTRLMSPPDDFDRCRYEAQVYKHKDDQRPSAVGYAYEVHDTDPASRGPNVTSHEENCETSAIGRALANMGYAKNREERPSRQEMEKVNRHYGNGQTPDDPYPVAEVRHPQGNGNGQGGGNPITERQLKYLYVVAKEKGLGDEQMHAALSRVYPERASVTQLTTREASAFIDHLQAMRSS